MTFANSLRVAVRLNCLNISHTKILTPPVSCRKNARLLSSSIERSRLIPQTGVFRTTPRSRNYWWTSSTSSVSSASPSPPPSPIPPKEPPIPGAEPTPAHTKDLAVASATPHDPSPATPVAPKEPAALNDDVAVPVEPSASNMDGTTSHVPIDVPIPDAVPLPLQYGDFAELGLTGWGPEGIVARSFEWIQVSTGMPWFYTIIVGSLFWRLSTVYWAMGQLRDIAKLREAPQIDKALAEYEVAKKSDDVARRELAKLKVRKARKDAGVNVFATALKGLIQIPPAIGVFLAVKRMCSLPVEQLKHSGMSLVPDLTLIPGTVAFDPYYITPILGIAALNLQLKLAMKDHADGNSPHYFNAFRIVSPVLLVFTSYFPAGLLLSIITGIAGSIIQSAMVRLPIVRKKMGIPRLRPGLPAPPSVLDTLKLVYKNFFARTAEKQVARMAQSKVSSRPKPLRQPTRRR